MYRTILVPSDGSPHANDAAHVGGLLAARFDARLILQHIALGKDAVPRALRDQAEAGELGELLLDAAERTARTAGAERIEAVTDRGDPGKRILERANRESVDLIVMGQRGHGLLQGLPVGSVTHKVVQAAPCRCATVRHPSAEGGRKVADLESLLVASDGSPHGIRAVELASDLAATTGARLSLLHVLLAEATLEELRHLVDFDQLTPATRETLEFDNTTHDSEEIEAEAYRSVVAGSAALEEIGKLIVERAKAVACERGAKQVASVIRDGDPAERILQGAEAQKSGAIVLGSRGLGMLKSLVLGSVSKKVDRLAHCTTIAVT
ncbi:MAG: universal stress protein [Pseudomonadota bacterium]